MTRLRRLCVAAVTAVVGLSTGHAMAIRAPMAVATTIDVLDQNFDVAADGEIVLQLYLSAAAFADPGSRIVITAHRPVGTRAGVADAIDGRLPRRADSLAFDLAALPQTGINAVTVTVPVERSTRTPEALQLASTGLYPIEIELRIRGEVAASLVTFVHRLPDADEADEQPLLVAIVMGTARSVRYDASTGGAEIDDGALAELTDLAESLEAASLPVATRLSPAVAAALRGSGHADLADRLGALLRRNELLATPEWPLDPTEAATAGRAELYRDWLRSGEDLLADFASTTPTRSVMVVDGRPSAAGVGLLRDAGARLLVLPAATYDRLPDSLGSSTDTTQLIQLEVELGTTVDAAVIDPIIDGDLVRPTDTPLLTAVHLVADLVATRQQIEEGGGLPSRHGIVLATPDVGIIPAPLLGRVTDLIAGTSALQAVSLEDLSVREDQLLVDGTEVVLALPEAPSPTIADRVAVADQLGLEAAATASMFPEGDPRSTAWQGLIRLMATRAVTDVQAASIAEQLRGEFATSREAVELPAPFSFTLTGGSTEIPVKLYNSSAAPLTVVVRLSTDKLTFPRGDLTVTLPGGEYTDVLIPVEVRSNGRFVVTLEVLTPFGNARLTPPVPLRANVTAISGLGNLFTGALALVLLTWWVRHVRNERRRRFEQQHPSTGPAAA